MPDTIQNIPMTKKQDNDEKHRKNLSAVDNKQRE